MNLEALAIEMPASKNHPNRVPFRGVLTTVDLASDRPPAGARGHRVLLTKAGAEQALPSLIGMALDYTPAFDGHDSRRKAGIITSAEVVGSQLVVSGYLFARDFPDLMRELRAGSGRLGMSYELADARVRDVRAPVWTLDEATFTGAAILLKKKAAYENTSIELAANSAIRPSKPDIKPITEHQQHLENTMTHKQSEELINVTQRMAAAAEALGESIARLNAQHEELSVRVDKIVAALENGSDGGDDDDSEAILLKSRITELEAANADLREKASKLNNATIAANGRKTLPPMVTTLLAKSGVEVSDPMDAAALDAAMAPLSIEQRIAVKSQMAKAGLIS
jgi:prefoldin subunit 5